MPPWFRISSVCSDSVLAFLSHRKVGQCWHLGWHMGFSWCSPPFLWVSISASYKGTVTFPNPAMPRTPVPTLWGLSLSLLGHLPTLWEAVFTVETLPAQCRETGSWGSLTRVRRDRTTYWDLNIRRALLVAIHHHRRYGVALGLRGPDNSFSCYCCSETRCDVIQQRALLMSVGMFEGWHHREWGGLGTACSVRYIPSR